MIFCLKILGCIIYPHMWKNISCIWFRISAHHHFQTSKDLPKFPKSSKLSKALLKIPKNIFSNSIFFPHMWNYHRSQDFQGEIHISKRLDEKNKQITQLVHKIWIGCGFWRRNQWFFMISYISHGLLNPIQLELRKKAPHMGPSESQARLENQH